MRIKPALNGHGLYRPIQSLFRLLQVGIEIATQTCVHHLVHGLDVLIVGFEHAPIALGNGHSRISGLGLLSQLQDGMTVLIQLLADLPQ